MFKITAEYAIPAMIVLDEFDSTDIEMLSSEEALEFVENTLIAEIEGVEEHHIKVLNVKCIETDSPNIYHAGAYYEVTLECESEDALIHISQEEDIVVYNWEEI